MNMQIVNRFIPLPYYNIEIEDYCKNSIYNLLRISNMHLLDYENIIKKKCHHSIMKNDFPELKNYSKI